MKLHYAKDKDGTYKRLWEFSKEKKMKLVI